MRQFTVRVVEIATTSPSGQIHVRCGGGPEVAPMPGQFYLARTDFAAQPFLRIPLYPFHTHAGGMGFSVDSAHPYAALEPGDELGLIGPCGRGFDLPHGVARLLLAADSPGRLHALIDFALARRCAVTLLLPPDAPLPSLSLDVEIQRGLLTADLAAWADLVAADTPDPQAFAKHVRQLRPNAPFGFVQALIAPPMPCGVGACQACWVEVGGHRRRACVDGPVFSL